jgi:hypothetical protein
MAPLLGGVCEFEREIIPSTEFRTQLDTTTGAPVSDPARIEKCPKTRRIGDRRSTMPASLVAVSSCAPEFTGERGPCTDAVQRQKDYLENGKSHGGISRWHAVLNGTLQFQSPHRESNELPFIPAALEEGSPAPMV